MATVTGFTKDRMLIIENTTVVGGTVVGDNLILTKRDGSTINAGNVRGATGSPGITNSEFNSGMSIESAARIAADNTLTSNLNAEIATRSSTDSGLATSINNEVASRISGDSAEATTRATYAKGLLVKTAPSENGHVNNANATFYDIPYLGVGFNQVSGRKYNVRGWVNVAAGFSSASIIQVLLTDAVNNVMDSSTAIGVPGVTVYPRLTVDFVYTANANAAVTFKMRATAFTSSTFAYANMPGFATANSTPWGQLVVEDLGS